MNWVVDGTRLKNDFKKFSKIIDNTSIARVIFPIIIPSQNNRQVGNIIEVYYPEDIFPKNWLNSTVPVVFDFKGLSHLENLADIKNSIFCLLPMKNASIRYVIQVSIGDFVANAKTGAWEWFVNNQVNILKQNIENQRRIMRPY